MTFKRRTWSSGYGRRLVLKVRNPAPNTGWTLFAFFVVKNTKMFEKSKVNEKEAGDDSF